MFATLPNMNFVGVLKQDWFEGLFHFSFMEWTKVGSEPEKERKNWERQRKRQSKRERERRNEKGREEREKRSHTHTHTGHAKRTSSW